ncbi:MAG: hypothetical protein ACI39C_14935 [Dietzia sp.]
METRTLPVYEAGSAVMPHVITGMDELVHHDTEWEPHSHPTHELLWNRAGASTAELPELRPPEKRGLGGEQNDCRGQTESSAGIEQRIQRGALLWPVAAAAKP